MNSRWRAWHFAVALIAFAVLGLLAQLLLLDPDRAETHHRSSFSYRADGFRGLHEVAQRLGYRATRHRVSYGQLPAPSETLLVQLDPVSMSGLNMQRRARMDEQQQKMLREWIHRGGVVLATLPGRRAVGTLGFAVELQGRRWFDGETLLAEVVESFPATRSIGVAGVVEGRGPLAGFRDSWSEPRRETAGLVGAYLAWERPREVVAGVHFGGEGSLEMQCFVESDVWATVVELAGRPIAVRRTFGDGAVWLVSSAYPFTNLGIGGHGTGQLAFALLDAACGTRRLVFDEYVHGLWQKRGLSAWVVETDLFYPVAGLLLLAFLLAWRGAVRSGPPRPERVVPRRAKEEFVIALGEIARRAKRHDAAARWLLEAHHSRFQREFGGRDAQVFAGLGRELAAGRLEAAGLQAFAARVRSAYRELRASHERNDTG